MILGIDEVGRGPWAGPLVVGAVVLGNTKIEGLSDSKKLTKKQREKLDTEIRNNAASFGLGWVEAAVIDDIGLSKALEIATKKAVEQIKTPYQEIIIDGTVNFLKNTNKGKYVTTLKKADLLVPSVSAASIIAKVARDNFMAKQEQIYPGYKFDKNVGYGTEVHRNAIEKFGITPIHRLSFKPLRKFFQKEYPSNTTKIIGDNGETVAVKYLKKNGYKIIDRNWRTKYCEIDIISQKDGVVFFSEVKYRKNDEQGGGLPVIDNKKLKQMKFAAELYACSNNIDNIDLRLNAISVSGQPPKVDELLEIL
jgi:ribonuclease HII